MDIYYIAMFAEQLTITFEVLVTFWPFDSLLQEICAYIVFDKVNSKCIRLENASYSIFVYQKSFNLCLVKDSSKTRRVDLFIGVLLYEVLVINLLLP